MPQKANSKDLNQRIYLIGMPGSGKSTEGARLAKSLGWKFIDLDKAIEEESGESIAIIFETQGEAAFRKLEQDQLIKTFSYTHTIIACGGGTVCYENNIERIQQHGISIYLKANSAFILSRLQGKLAERPLFKGLGEIELIEKIKETLQLREPYYLKATATVELPFKTNKSLYNKASSLIEGY
jgi:shikimate kinase